MCYGLLLRQGHLHPRAIHPENEGSVLCGMKPFGPWSYSITIFIRIQL